MWKKLLILITVLSTSLWAWSADGDYFQAETPGGVMMKFQIISEAEKTCGIASGAIDRNTEGVITIPEMINEYRVTRIGDQAFYNCSGLTSIEFPANLTSIGSYAFYGCPGLTSIEFPANLTSIGSSAFRYCSGLTSIEFPANLTSIGWYAFDNCTNIRHVVSHIRKPFSLSVRIFPADILSSATLTVPYGCTNLYQSASGWNFQTIKDMEGTYEDLTLIQFADSLTKAYCIKNWDINLDGELSLYEASQVTSLRSFGTDYKIVSFDELKYFENLSEIGPYFQNQTKLESVTIPNSVTSIGNSAFENCSALTSIQFPDKLETIGKYAFRGCSALTSVALPKGLTNIPDYIFAECSSLSDVTLPDSLETIGVSAFANCKSLTSISLPEGLSELFAYAFDGSGLKEMVLPSTLTQIANYALTGKIIYCPIKEPISVGTPSRDQQNTVLYVPAESVEAYKNASGWKHFIVISENNIDIDWTEGQIVVNVESPGELYMTLLERDEEEIRRLKICGTLNSSDLLYLAECKGLIANLESIDLSDVTLVYDGGCYRSMEYEDSEVMWSFHEYNFYLTEETYEKHWSTTGLKSTKKNHYYGHDLAGLFWGGPYKHIVMPRGITRAASYAFNKCTNLQSVEFANSLKYVGNSAFAECVSLLTLNLEEVDSIGASAFSGCRAFNVENMDKVQHIGSKAFYNCSRLNGVNGVVSLPQCDSIAANAFENSSGIEKIEFSENLKFLGSKAFMKCNYLTSVNLPSSLQALSSETFSGCTMLKEVNYSDNLLKVHIRAFDSTPWYANLPVEGGVKYMGHIAMYVVDKENATSIREGTTSIADGFNGSALSNSSLPASLRIIGDNAFQGSTFNSVVMPEGLEQIGVYAFARSQQLTKVTLNESLKEVGDYAFQNCDQLTIVNFNSIDLQTTDLFYNCGSLAKVNIGAKVSKLPEGTFKGCSNLIVVKFEERTDDTPFEIGAWAFYSCNSLTSLDLPSTTNKVGAWAFYSCNSLTSLDLPSTASEIGEYAFSGCYNMKKFTVPEQVSVLNQGVFYNCLMMGEVKLHEGIKIIGDEAFAKCSTLQSIELPEGLDSIGTKAFEKCYRFTEFTIPSTVTRIGRNILCDCYYLKTLNSRITHPMEVRGGFVELSAELIKELYNLSSNSFAYYDHEVELYYQVTLVVPVRCLNRYKQTSGWSKIANIVEDADDMTVNNYLLTIIDTIPAGSMAQLGIYLENDREDFTAYQFDLNLPPSIEMDTDKEGQYLFVMGDRNDVSHAVIVEKLAQPTFATKRNRYRFVCISANNAPIKGTSGTLLKIPLTADANMKPGDYEAKLENIIFTQQDGTENALLVRNFNITITEACGDVNGDGAITVSDIVSVINHIMLHTEGIFNKEAADANQDGEINISDVVNIVNLIMNN